MTLLTRFPIKARQTTIAATFALACVVPGAARAHFLWLKYDDDRAAVRAFLSETPAPDSADLLKPIEQAKVSAGGRPLSWTKAEDTYRVLLPESRPKAVDGECDLGVKSRDGVKFRLIYTARAQLGPETSTQDEPGSHLRVRLAARPGQAPVAVVTFRGKPAAGAVVKAMSDDDDVVELKSDAEGRVEHPKLASGKVGLLAKWSEKAPGDLAGKPYDEVRYYATLTVAPPPTAPQTAKPNEADEMLKKAHQARASWGPSFPGFTADVTVHLEGETASGTLDVSPDGEVALDLPSGPAKDWATPQLRSLVMHRGLNGPTELDPGAKFLEPENGHPLGRLIQLSDDRMGSAYRIKGDEILEVNRTMKDKRFSNRVLRNHRNAEGKLLPMAFTVSYWDVASGRLDRTETFHDAWERVGTLDLPKSHTQIATADGKSSVKQIEFSNVKLKAAPLPASEAK